MSLEQDVAALADSLDNRDGHYEKPSPFVRRADVARDLRALLPDRISIRVAPNSGQKVSTKEKAK